MKISLNFILLFLASQPQEENKSENTNDGIELTSVQTASFTPQTITNLNDSLQTISISAFKEQKKLENSSEISDVANIEQNSLSSEFVVNSNSNLNPEQKTKERAWNKIKQFLLFPKKNNATDLDKEGNLSKKAKKSNEENPKPMIFFKFAFKIRQIPLTNASAYSNDSKIINVKKLDFKPFPSNDLNPNLENERQRRESKSEKEVNEFFDDFPPFQDANINELFPKPESLFSDLLFHREPFSKFSQKKRDLKKQDSVDDVFKFFSEFFDKAFIKTEQELEERNPILDFLRGEEESKKEKNLFHTVGFDLKNSEKNPNLQERLQRNLKPLDQNSENDIIKSQENPVIIVDNVVKIEKVHLHNDGSNKFKSKKKKKRETKKHHNSKGVLHPALSGKNTY